MIPSVWEGMRLSIHFWVTLASGTHLLLPHPDGAGELTVGLFEAMALSCCPFAGPHGLSRILPMRGA